jgi:hypothetical protein
MISQKCDSCLPESVIRWIDLWRTAVGRAVRLLAKRRFTPLRLVEVERDGCVQPRRVRLPGTLLASRASGGAGEMPVGAITHGVMAPVATGPPGTRHGRVSSRGPV